MLSVMFPCLSVHREGLACGCVRVGDAAHTSIGKWAVGLQLKGFLV